MTSTLAPCIIQNQVYSISNVKYSPCAFPYPSLFFVLFLKFTTFQLFSFEANLTLHKFTTLAAHCLSQPTILGRVLSPLPFNQSFLPFLAYSMTTKSSDFFALSPRRSLSKPAAAGSGSGSGTNCLSKPEHKEPRSAHVRTRKAFTRIDKRGERAAGSQSKHLQEFHRSSLTRCLSRNQMFSNSAFSVIAIVVVVGRS